MNFSRFGRAALAALAALSFTGAASRAGQRNPHRLGDLQSGLDRHQAAGPARKRIREGQHQGPLGAVGGFEQGARPLATGALAAFPIVFTSMMLILHQRYGGPACAAVMANGITGLIGFGIAAYVLHVSAQSLGVPAALTLALCITVAWNLGVFAVREKIKA